VVYALGFDPMVGLGKFMATGATTAGQLLYAPGAHVAILANRKALLGVGD
jgi:hypothetical protein